MTMDKKHNTKLQIISISKHNKCIIQIEFLDHFRLKAFVNLENICAKLENKKGFQKTITHLFDRRKGKTKVLPMESSFLQTTLSHNLSNTTNTHQIDIEGR